MAQPRRHLRLLAALTFLAAACGGDNGGGGSAATNIAIGGGNLQSVKYGLPVPTAPSVVVTNSAGPMEGVQVTFSVTGGGGSVTPSTATTNAQGVATVGAWTLGPAPGENTLKAQTGALSVTIRATAVTGPPAAMSINAGNNQQWVEQSQVPIDPSVTVTDGQYPVPNVQVSFAVTAGGGSVSGAVPVTDANGVATVGGWRLGSTATNTLSASIPSTSITPVTFSATAEPLVITALSKVSGDNQTGFAGNFAGSKVAVSVLNQFNQPTEGVPVNFTVGSGAGSIPAGPITTNSSGQAVLSWWRFGAVGTQTVNATAGAVPAQTFTANAQAVPISNYRINVFYPSVSGVTPPSDAVKTLFANAAARWQGIIVGGLDPVELSPTNPIGPASINTGLPGVGTIPCVPQVTTTIKDINIYVYVRPIDGAQQILGFGTPLYTRSGSDLPAAGCMVFDSEDAGTIGAALYDVILHEMGHVLGIGTIWTDLNLLQGACPASTKPYFTGPSSQQAFLAALPPGVSPTRPIVPVEGQGDCGGGTRDGHWSEAVFGNELMTGFIGTTNPLSAITSASVRDMGYVVNDAVSDPYTVPNGAALRMGPATDAVRLQELPVKPPITVVDSKGRTVQIRDR